MKALKTNKHIHLSLISIAVYALFIVRGLSSNHYQDLSVDFYFVEGIDIFIFLIPTCFLILKLISKKQDYFKDSMWLAFYTTIPFFFFDLIFLGIIKGFGIEFFSKWWFLSIFYFILWIEFPIIGYLMEKNSLKEEKKHFVMLVISIVSYLVIYWGGSFSNHYLEWNQDMKIMRLLNLPLILSIITYSFLRHCSKKESYVKDSLFLAVYMSFFFVVFDFHYLAISKNLGINYLIDYWFVVLFYPLFWVVIPTVGMIMKNSASKTNISNKK